MGKIVKILQQLIHHYLTGFTISSNPNTFKNRDQVFISGISISGKHLIDSLAGNSSLLGDTFGALGTNNFFQGEL